MGSAALGVAALVAGVIVIDIARDDDPRSPQIVEGGPLTEPHAHGSLMNVKVGAKWTDAYETLDVSGDEPGTIVSVESVGTSDGLEYLGSRVAPNMNDGVPQVFRQWPPGHRDWLGQTEPAVGATIPTTGRPGYPMVLLMGYRVTTDGRLTRNGVRVTYEVGDTTYVKTFQAKWVVCGPSARGERGGCPMRD